MFTLSAGFLFPAVIWGFGQILFSYQANGSLIKEGNKIIGSEIIGQQFVSPKYFHPRPSAAGSGYDPLGSSGTNLGPTSKKLIVGFPDDPETPDTDESYLGVQGLAKAYREENGLKEDHLVPVDAVTRSGSGLDPHISPQNALLQASRVARERGIDIETVNELIKQSTAGRFLGLFGETRVNVLSLNLALDRFQRK